MRASKDQEGQDEDLSLTEMVTEELARHGLEAVVVEKRNGLEMFVKDAGSVWVDAQTDLAQWDTVPPVIKRRKAHALASRLAHIHKAQRGGSGEGPQMPPLSRLMPFGVGLALGIMALLGYRALTKEEKKPPPDPNTPSESTTQRTQRLARACEATRGMLWNGSGSWGAMPLEGWVVELWLARKEADPPLMRNAQIISMVDARKLSPKADAEIAAISDGAATLEDGSVGTTSGVKFVLTDGYARAFFAYESRDRFISMGERLAKSANADWGALYAHCAQFGARDVGVWFWGKDPGKASASLVWSMGIAAGPKTTEHTPATTDWNALNALTARFDESSLSSLIRNDGARSSNAEGLSLTYPFDKQTRAAESSRAIAKELGLR